MSDDMTPEAMKAAADGLREHLAAAVAESAAIIGWHGVFRAIRDAATLQEVGYVAGVAEAAAIHIQIHHVH